MGRGKDKEPRALKYGGNCVMCGMAFASGRPEARTDTNRCRSALRRWRKLYQCDPTTPPGPKNLRPPYWNRVVWLEAYLPVGHPLRPAPVAEVPKPKRKARVKPKRKARVKPKRKAKAATAE